MFDETHSPENVALYSFVLGTVFGSSILIAMNYHHYNFALFVCSISLFHFSEYWTTARYRKRELSLNSFLLNHSREYHIAMIFAVCEYIVEALFIPSLKHNTYTTALISVGLILTFSAQFLRITGIITAASNFQHQISTSKHDDHKLVTTGVYAVFRHPAYTGFYWWGIGSQALLCNPISTVGFAIALHSFFKDRIAYEEEVLIEFFDEYREYRRRSHTFIPFIE